MRGFTLLELLIVIAIVAVLAAVAVPSYVSYLREKEFSGTVKSGNSLKDVVSACIKKNRGVALCSSGQGGIPDSVTAAKGIPGTSVQAGVITATSPTNADYSVAGATYILTPTYKSGSTVTFAASGSGCDKDYADCH